MNEDDIKVALESGKVAKYVVDFPNPTTVKLPNTTVTPHLGASTQESEDNCAKWQSVRFVISWKMVTSKIL